MEVTEVEPGPGEETVEQAGPVLHPPEPGPRQRGQLADVLLGEVGQRAGEPGRPGPGLPRLLRRPLSRGFSHVTQRQRMVAAMNFDNLVAVLAVAAAVPLILAAVPRVRVPGPVPARRRPGSC